jgi:hypothetical protein
MQKIQTLKFNQNSNYSLECYNKTLLINSITLPIECSYKFISVIQNSGKIYFNFQTLLSVVP